jgi:hypothetical protein
MAVGLITEPRQVDVIVSSGRPTSSPLGRGVLFNPRGPMPPRRPVRRRIIRRSMSARARKKCGGDFLKLRADKRKLSVALRFAALTQQRRYIDNKYPRFRPASPDEYFFSSIFCAVRIFFSPK